MSEMRASLSKIKSLLINKKVIDIENDIAAQRGCEIYRDNLPVLAKLLKEEVEQSQLPVEELEQFAVSNGDEIREFSANLLKDESPKRLSAGIAMSYSIYLIYLETKSKELLTSYIKKRRIPGSRIFLNKLDLIKLKMHI